MGKNIITICQNQFHLENYIRSSSTPIHKIFTFNHFISQKLKLINYKNNEDYKTVHPIEEKVLIKKIIEKTLKKENDFDLFNINSITDLFIEAIKIVQNEKLDINRKEWFLTKENRFFRGVYLEYLKHLENNKLLSISESLDLISKNQDQTEEFISIGFLKKNKLVEEFLFLINHSQKKSENIDNIFKDAEINVYEETENEMLQVSTECIKHISKNKKCAIIVPNLDKYIDHLRIYFSDPVLLKKYHLKESIQVNSSVKKSLNHNFVIQNLINLFSFLNNNQIDLFLLKKSFKQILPLDSYIEIHKFFDYLFIDGVKKINFIQFRKIFTTFYKTPTNKNTLDLEKLIFDLEIKPEGNRLIDRCNSFMKFINSDFFKSKITTDSEIKSICSFYNLLNELISLRISDNTISFSDFLYTLKEHLRITAESTLLSNQNRIDIFGLFDEIIDHYDYIYAINLTDELLEIENTQNPFIPFNFKNEIAQLKKSEQLLKQIFSHNKSLCDFLFLSYSKFNSEIENTPSQLISSCSKKYISSAIIKTTLENKIKYINDNLAPKIAKPCKLNNVINLLNTYSISPLWAFYETRLGCRTIESLKLEKFNSKTRGIVIHQSMQKIWEELNDQKSLRDMKNEGRLASFIIQKVTQVVISNYYCQKIHESLKQIEIKNLSSLIHKFLEIELEREYFVIKNLEYKQNAEIDGISFEYRVDRVDETQNLSFIIDYKSGSSIPTKSQWLNETIQNHQVPIYLLFTKLNKSSGFAFFSINNRFMQINYFFADQENNFSESIKYIKTSSSLDEFKDKWFDEIKEKLNLFINGHADLNFKNDDDFVQCQLKQILRIPEYKYLQENNNG